VGQGEKKKKAKAEHTHATSGIKQKEKGRKAAIRGNVEGEERVEEILARQRGGEKWGW